MNQNSDISENEKILINKTNRLIDIENKPEYLNLYLKDVYNFYCDYKIHVEDKEEESIYLEFLYLNEKERSEYYLILSNCVDFINGKISISNYEKYEIRPFDKCFMLWFLSHTNELKRLLSFEEFGNLEMKYKLSKIFNKEFESLNQLNQFKNAQ